jgi:glycosyltransferase involved in cell wall biosynthesis
MGARGREMVLESLTERHVFSQVLGLYAKMLGRRPLAGEQVKIARITITSGPGEFSSPIEAVWDSAPGRPKPKLLLLVTEDWYFYGHRLYLARAAREAGYDVALATHVAEYGERIRAEGIKLIPIRLSRTSRNPFSEVLATIELAKIYRKENPDIIHHVAMKPILYGSWAARFSGQRAVVNEFAGLGYVFTGTKRSTRLTRAVVSEMLRSAFKGASVVAVFQNVDDYDALHFRAIVSPPITKVIQPGVSEDEFVPTPEAAGEPIILLAGRMLWDKGVGEFVKAAEIIRGRGIQARFVLAGRRDPSNPSSISEEQLRTWQAGGTVEWWGQREDMPAIMAAVHIVALPSYREGFPKVLLEAAASMRPVVATDVPGCREIVRDGENGLLVPPRDAGALAEALVRLIDSPGLRRRMGERGRQIITRDFTTRHAAAQFLDIYAKLRERSALKDTREKCASL